MIGLRAMMSAAGASTTPGGLWTPALISTALWLDADDESSITVADYHEVTQWSDKSGNNRHATVPSGYPGPYYYPAEFGKNVSFNGYNNVLTTQSYLSGIVHTVYIVAHGAAQGGYFFVKGNIENIDNSFSLQSLYGDPLHFAKGLAHHSTGNQCDGTFSRSDISYFLHSLSISYNGGSENYFYEDGNQKTRQYTESVQGSGSGSSIMHIGCTPEGESYTTANLDICEFIHIDGFHSESDRQKVEGYLAHKWDAIAGTSDMRQALPALHPYKTEPPMA